MTLVDIILLIILSGFVLFGLWFGLIHTLGALVGTLAGAYVASHYFSPIAEFLGGKFGGSLPIWKIIVFIFIFTIINRLVGLLFYILEKIFKLISIIPFLKTVNRLAGAVLGFAEGVLVLGLTLHVAGVIPVSAGFISRIIEPSVVAKWLIGVARVLLPLLPAALRVLGLPPVSIP